MARSYYSSVATLTVSFALMMGIMGGKALRDVPIENLNQSSSGFTLVATLYPFGSIETWEGECFKNTNGYVTYTQDSGLGYVVIQTWNAQSLTCSDSYEFKVQGQTIATDTFYTSVTNPHEVAFDSQSKELRATIKQHGVSVYVNKNGLKVCNPKDESGLGIVKDVE